MVELGYTLFPPRRSSEPGYSKIQVVLQGEPTGLHFDPHVLIVSVCSINDIDRISIHHPWHAGKYRLCAGPIHMEDFKGKEFDIFTYGGELDVQPADQNTVCEISSPAPVLTNFAEHSLARVLAEESEILLAQEKASFASDAYLFNARLANTDPMDLYYASLLAVLKRYHQLPETYDGLNIKFERALHDELEYLQKTPQFGMRFTREKSISDLFEE